MTELRTRMIEDMELAGHSKGTQDAYIRVVRQLAGHFRIWHHSKRHLQQRARLLLSLLAPLRLAECLLIADVAAEADRLSEGKDASEGGFSPSCPRCGSHRVEHVRERCRGPGP